MLSPEMKSNINKLWDRFWSNGISNPLTAIEQISYLIFMKRLEDEDNKNKNNARLRNEIYNSIFAGNEDCKWSVWTKYESNKMLEHVRNEVFPFLKTIDGKKSLYSKYMDDAVFVITSGSLLSESVKIINDLHITEQNRDAQGDIYEYILSELRTSGKNGQFRTPNHIRKLMAALTQPKVGDMICDPACGTAGFIVSAMMHILKEHTSDKFIETDGQGFKHNFVGDQLSKEDYETLLNDTFYGSDIDQTMVRIAMMNLMMHGIRNPHITHRNSLVECEKEKGKYTLVLANPPFKGSINKEEIKGKFSITTTKTELLYLDLMCDLLQTGGRCAVIVPDGVLFGSSNAHKKIRERIVDECSLSGVISMPSGVFKPYAGVSTGILVFTKGEPTEKVWFYNMEADGFTLDDKRTFIDGKGDIPDIIEKFHDRENQDFSDRTGKCFFVPADEIRENDYDLSISKYKEIEYEEIEYEPPEVLYNRLQSNEDDILSKMKEVQEKLGECVADK
ncbi:SAM-dependent DNA methyltransferase [Methanohalophilus sp. RSK]|uniref:type I restriction-modification system subunit M n=1 Tax=Methanohalophilus sp. RSK TaxID=2485783 RepID=UPI000F43C5F3|nr:type I restriction-modification system subunit M [Methanohalophilus sp. RSK]RNI14526.1 SAM-dependent DNA methyltransferase [Methanohalophilus sp. RSK]